MEIKKQVGSKRIFNILAILCIVLMMSAVAIHTADAASKSPEFNKAVKLYNKGQFEKAIPILEKYVETHPEVDAYYVLSYSYYKTSQHDKAREYFKILYEKSPHYSPTPELERRLNRQVRDARPDPGDEKMSVESGELPPEARDLDPTKYKVIDNSERLIIPNIPSTNTYERKAASTKKKPASATTSVKAAPKDTESKAVVAVADDVPAKAEPIKTENIAKKETATKPTAKTQEVSRKQKELQRKRKQAQKKVEPAKESPLDDISGMIPESVSKWMAGGMLFMVLGIGFGVYILVCLPIFLIARKLGEPRPILAFVPIVNTWLVIKMADLSIIWFILTLIFGLPIFYAIMKISEKLGKSSVVGLLLAFFLGPIGLLILAIIGSPGGGGGAAAAASAGALAGGDALDVSGEPDLDLPDMDDMGFDDMEDDFATDSGFGSDEGVGAHTDDFGVEEANPDDFDMGDSGGDTGGGDMGGGDAGGDAGGGDSFEMDDFGDSGDSEGGGSDDFGVDFDDESF